LGNQKVLLPLNNGNYWRTRRSLKKLIISEETLAHPSHPFVLNKFQLKPIGIPITIFYNVTGICDTFIQRQYEYGDSGLSIKAREGDVVIDCGGCWGDTALYFANEVGVNGHVYIFEFIPSNLNILNRNIELNPKHKNHITVVEHPVWNMSDQLVYYKDNGPASAVSLENFPECTGSITSLTIDDLVLREKITKIDFIKMDIEGAEMSALHGAEQTIKNHRPTLALAVYHQLSDFHNVPRYLSGIHPDYVFFLKHATPLLQETVLFAVPPEKIRKD
jgi:FkbM family methyltransferase